MSHRCIIVPADRQANAQALCAKMASGGAGAGMFLRGLCPIGQSISTHYISSGDISEQFAAILPCKHVVTEYDAESQMTEAITEYPGMPEQAVAIAAQVGISTTLDQINALYSAIDVSDQEPEAAMARLGLQFAPETTP